MTLRTTTTAFMLTALIANGSMAQLPPPTQDTITVGLVPDPAGGKNLLLRVEAMGVTDLYGLSFEVKFPKKRLRWKKKASAAGSFLSASETIQTVVIDRQKPRGTLNVGASRLGEVAGATGSGTVIEIGFVNRNKPGPREITLSRTEAFDSSAQPIPDLTWVVAPFESGS